MLLPNFYMNQYATAFEGYLFCKIVIFRNRIKEIITNRHCSKFEYLVNNQVVA